MSTIDNNFSSLINELSLDAAPAEQNKKKDQLGQGEFLKLMVTQLKNQDPFKPMENGDFIAQMAQFSSVSGLADLQQSFEKLATSMQSNQALQASSLVGRSVMVPSESAVLSSGGSVTGAIDLPTSSGQVMLAISDEAGQLVRRIDLGSRQAGEVAFNWDGLTSDGQQAPAGRYFMTAAAVFDGEAVALETLVSASVESVTLGNNGSGLALNLTDGNVVGLSSVREIK